MAKVLASPSDNKNYYPSANPFFFSTWNIIFFIFRRRQKAIYRSRAAAHFMLFLSVFLLVFSSMPPFSLVWGCVCVCVHNLSEEDFSLFKKGPHRYKLRALSISPKSTSKSMYVFHKTSGMSSSFCVMANSKMALSLRGHQKFAYKLTFLINVTFFWWRPQTFTVLANRKIDDRSPCSVRIAQNSLQLGEFYPSGAIFRRKFEKFLVQSSTAVKLAQLNLQLDVLSVMGLYEP